jgi:transposase
MDTRRRYPSDLTNPQWAQVCRFIPAPKPGGRPDKYDRREIFNALLYVARTGSSVAGNAARPPPLDHRLLVLPVLEEGRHLRSIDGRIAGRPPRGRGAASAALGGHSADVQDPDGAKLVFESIRGRFSRLKSVWADGIYRRLTDWVFAWRRAYPIRLEVVEREGPGFRVVKRRWVVERTFAWLGRCRRLSKDYEGTIASSEAFVKLAMIQLMARRLVKKLE